MNCEAARANTMIGGPDLSLGFPWNGKNPYPHQAAWSLEPANQHALHKKKGTYQGKAEKGCECLSLKKACESLDQ